MSAKTGKQYTALIGIKDDKEYFLSFDKLTMLRLSNLTLAEFEALKVGDEINV